MAHHSLSELTNVREGYGFSVLRLITCLLLSLYCGQRGWHIRDILIDHVTVLADASASQLAFLTIFQPFNKNDPNGKGRHIPVLPRMRDGYLCACLFLSMYLLSIKDELRAAIAVYDATPDGIALKKANRVRKLYLFPATTKNGLLDFTKPWSWDAAHRDLRGLVAAAVHIDPAERRYTWHSGRHSVFEMAANAGLGELDYLGWGAWRGEDAKKYQHPSLEMMRRIAGVLVSEEKRAPPIHAPYKGQMSGSHGLPAVGDLNRMFQFAANCVTCYVGPSAGLSFIETLLSNATRANLTFFSTILPPYDPPQMLLPVRFQQHAMRKWRDGPAAIEAVQLQALAPDVVADPCGAAHESAQAAAQAGFFFGLQKGLSNLFRSLGAAVAPLSPKSRANALGAFAAAARDASRLPLDDGAMVDKPSLSPDSAKIPEWGDIGWQQVVPLWEGGIHGLPPLRSFRDAQSGWRWSDQWEKQKFAMYSVLLAEILRVVGQSDNALAEQLLSLAPADDRRVAAIRSAIERLEQCFAPRLALHGIYSKLARPQKKRFEKLAPEQQAEYDERQRFQRSLRVASDMRPALAASSKRRKRRREEGNEGDGDGTRAERGGEEDGEADEAEEEEEGGG